MDHTRQGAVSGPVGCSGRSRSLRISTRRDSHSGLSSLSWTWISSIEISPALGDFRYRVRNFARSNHSSRGLVLPTSRPTTVSITPRRYPKSPGSSRTAHGAAHGASRRTAATMLLAHLGREIRFYSGLNRRCITRPASSRHLHPVNVLDPARRVRVPT